MEAAFGTARAAGAVGRGSGAGPTARARESALGPPADLRRAGLARLPGIADKHPPSSCSGTTRSGAAARRTELARVPARASGEHRRVRFLHRRERVFAPLLRAVLHPTAARASGLPAARGSQRRLVTQQARNLGADFSEQGVRFLIRDRDSKYSGPFDGIFRSDGWLLVLNRATWKACSASTSTITTARGRIVPLNFARPTLTRNEMDRIWARSTAATASVASSTSTTEPPPETRHE
jgi:hypothetical protein